MAALLALYIEQCVIWENASITGCLLYFRLVFSGGWQYVVAENSSVSRMRGHWTQSSNPQRSYCDFSVWPYDLDWTNALPVALGSEIIFTKFDLPQLIRGWIIAFLILIAYVMTRCDLDLWPLTLNFYSTSGVMRLNCKIWKKPHNSPLSYWRFSTFSLCNFRGWGTTDKRFSGVRRPNITKLCEDIGPSFLHEKFVSTFRYLAAFSNASGSKLSDVEDDAKFRTFWLLLKLD